ncbi:MAG TPA: hypothetical protein VFO71_06700 [Gemmatimonadales bacterium]|nr:hypothetical protein [Gemmatimonadales bacterium]
MIRILSAVLVLLLAAGRAEAQGLSPAVKYGKWVLLAGSIGLNYLAVRAHNSADDAFDALEAQCTAVQERCAIGPAGTYSDPAIEDLYQTSLRYDRRARLWLIGGETALIGSAALFIWELARPKNRPDNIPFEPEVRSLRAGGTGVGLRLGF